MFRVIYVLFIITQLIQGSLITLSIVRSRAVRDRSSGHVNQFGEEGEFVQLKEVDVAISKASTIVIMKCENHTVISYFQKKGLYSLANVDYVTNLFDPKLCLVVTGYAGDCRETIKFTKDTVLNSTFTYGTAIPGRMIANAIGKMFQESTTGSVRPFICHAFICDMRNNESTKLFEIEPSGNIQEIYGSVVGMGATGTMKINKGGYSLLESKFHPFLNLEKAKDLSREILLYCKNITQNFDMDADLNLSQTKQNETDLIQLIVI
jgi:20S proteasome alpha/beta subunit